MARAVEGMCQGQQGAGTVPRWVGHTLHTMSTWRTLIAENRFLESYVFCFVKAMCKLYSPLTQARSSQDTRVCTLALRYPMVWMEMMELEDTPTAQPMAWMARRIRHSWHIWHCFGRVWKSHSDVIAGVCPIPIKIGLAFDKLWL